MRTFFTFILLVAFSVFQGAAQVNQASHSDVAVVGDTLTYSVTSLFNVIFKSKDEGLAKIETQINGNTRQLQFFLLPGEEAGVYTAKIECYPTYTSPEYVEFTIDFKNSIVKVADDYVWMTDNTISISPLANDESSLGSIEIKDVSHVQNGTATLESDGSITYTKKQGTTKDYIVYSAADSIGTYDVGTIYIGSPSDTVLDYKETNLFAYVGQKEVILLDDLDFNHVGDLNYGTLEIKSDFAFEYVPSSIGTDTIVFSRSGASHIYMIKVLDKETSTNNFVVDDKVYTANNTPVTFNVFENDKSQQFVVTSHSPELTYVGNGVFTYAPTSADEGYHAFSYTVTNGASTETGKIEIVVSDFNPITSFTYMFDTKAGNSFVVDYDVPISTYSFTVENGPTFGTLTILGSDDHITSCDTIRGANRIVYTPYEGFTGYDQFEVFYCPSEGADCQLVKIQANVVAAEDADCACVDNCVWSGDANNDGKVDAKDFLSIGKYIGALGTPREAGGTTWIGESATDFGITAAHGKDIKYADCNGDGVINQDDFEVVKQNIGKYHTVQSSINIGSQSVPFYFTTEIEPVEDGDKYTFDFYIGDESYPVVDLSGISFALSLNSERLDSSSVALHEVEGNFFTQYAPHYTGAVQPSKGKVQISMIKTNALSSTGFGIVTSMSCIIEDEAIGVRPVYRNAKDLLEVIVSDVSILDGNGNHFSLNGSARSYDLSKEEEVESSLQIFPNPASDKIVIHNSNENTITSVIMDVMGKKCIETKDRIIDVRSLTEGVYFIIIADEENKTTETRKIAITR